MARLASRHERVGRAIDRLGGGLLLVLAAGLWGAGESLLAIVGLVLAVLLLLRELLPPSEAARSDAPRDEREIEGSDGGDHGTPGLYLHDHDGHVGGGHHDAGDWGSGDLGGHAGGDGGGDGGGGH